MTAAQAISLLAAAAGVLTAAAALLKQWQQGRTITAHDQRITNLEGGTTPPLKP